MMAQDEGRFGRISRPKRCWAPPGVRPTAPVQLVREFVQVFAAVAPQTGELISLILPTANTAMMKPASTVTICRRLRAEAASAVLTARAVSAARSRSATPAR